MVPKLVPFELYWLVDYDYYTNIDLKWPSEVIRGQNYRSKNRLNLNIVRMVPKWVPFELYWWVDYDFHTKWPKKTSRRHHWSKLPAKDQLVFKLVNIKLVTYSVSDISVSNALIFQPVVLTSEGHWRSIFL